MAHLNVPLLYPRVLFVVPGSPIKNLKTLEKNTLRYFVNILKNRYDTYKKFISVQFCNDSCNCLIGCFDEKQIMSEIAKHVMTAISMIEKYFFFTSYPNREHVFDTTNDVIESTLYPGRIETLVNFLLNYVSHSFYRYQYSKLSNPPCRECQVEISIMTNMLVEKIGWVCEDDVYKTVKCLNAHKYILKYNMYSRYVNNFRKVVMPIYHESV